MGINLSTSSVDSFGGLYPRQPQPKTESPPVNRKLSQQAKVRLEQGDYLGAIDLLTCLIESDPICADHYNNRGYAYFQDGEVELAIADYSQAIQLNPTLDRAYNNRANAYARLGDLYAALLDYDQTLDLNPLKIQAWINRGITFRQLQIYELALDNLDFALRLGRLEGYIYAERGRTYHLMGDWNWAIADYQRAIDHFQNTPQLSGAEQRQYQRVLHWKDQLLKPLAD
ncbi:tetratricopeptide repeat protein [Roseofilum reptotaenium CS-1145]|uniref:tetratricopeptide repeat protein n=1 Tax=Roseofilum reptotaenium TaxID=1233427 RepID=UPI000A3E1A04|nr:tetratricopeptide repeat protein [Roseofilum reptotaenium]MDB9518112.1 tetratricopeptide repeat protein [Roseofilum reptotaenium CS-1145]